MHNVAPDNEVATFLVRMSSTSRCEQAAPPKGKGKGLAWNPKGKGKGAPSRAQNEIAALASRAQQLLPSAGYGGPPMSTMAVSASGGPPQSGVRRQVWRPTKL